MKILHLSFHVGCVREIKYVMQRLGHTVDFIPKLGSLDLTAGARKITADEANSIWQTCQDIFNSYDVIITSDIAALSRIFLQAGTAIKPHVIVWICNRITICMDDQEDFFKLLTAADRKKVSIVPYTEFERFWANRLGIWTPHHTITPTGGILAPHEDQIIKAAFSKGVQDYFKGNSIKVVTEPKNTFFVLNYGNNTEFLPLIEILQSHGINAITGHFSHPSELSSFRGVIHLPDAFSKFTGFELLQLGLPVFLPSEEFISKTLTNSQNSVTKINYFFNINGYGGPFDHSFTSMCEWYYYPDSKIFFNSIEDLIERCRLFKDTDYERCRAAALYDAAYNEERCINAWRHLLSKIHR